VAGQRTASFHRFVRTLVPGPRRIIEIGCGSGELALALAADGHEVTAIDPEAPEGRLFRRVRLEDFTPERPFDIAVASVSLHHVAEPAVAVERIAALLRPRGLVVVEEFAKERLRGSTARWYYHQRRALAEVGRQDSAVADTFEGWSHRSLRDLSDVHTVAELRGALESRFHELHFEWTPYLYSYALDDSLEHAEGALIESGEIEPTGCRYVGEKRS
jgi:2-polyprenyl-3-methyl-5-hydroxy-6-metoxy-1,4-benzoquinol methylase